MSVLMVLILDCVLLVAAGLQHAATIPLQVSFANHNLVFPKAATCRTHGKFQDKVSLILWYSYLTCWKYLQLAEPCCSRTMFGRWAGAQTVKRAENGTLYPSIFFGCCCSCTRNLQFQLHIDCNLKDLNPNYCKYIIIHHDTLILAWTNLIQLF